MKRVTEPRERIIVALNSDDLNQVAALVSMLAPYVGMFEIGLQLIMSVGAPKAVGLVKLYGSRAFLNGKFHDTPQKVGRASLTASSMMGTEMFSVHVSSGRTALLQAVKNKGDALLIGAMAPSALTAQDFYETGLGQWPGVKPIEKYPDIDFDSAYLIPMAVAMAKLAHETSADGIMCSATQLRHLNAHLDKEVWWHDASFLRIVRGACPAWALPNDDEEIVTPAEAVALGADYLIIGSPIISPPAKVPSPIEAAKLISEEIGQALSSA